LDRHDLQTQLDQAGFTLAEGSVDVESRSDLLQAIDVARRMSAVHHRSGQAFAARGLLWKADALSARLAASGLTALACRLLGDEAFAIDAIYFDKHAGANWTVPGHQDRVHPVAADAARRHRTRDGITYAEPDAFTLARMVALRVHFDPTDHDTGALGVVPGSHRDGILTTAQILAVPLERYVTHAATPGDVLAMRPLLLHRSSPSKGDGQRRVLHVVYATSEPTNGVRWRQATA
jgi:hypothetical protein